MDLWVTVMCFAHRVLKLLERKIMAVISWLFLITAKTELRRATAEINWVGC